MIHWEDKVIISDRVFDENPEYKERYVLIDELEKLKDGAVIWMARPSSVAPVLASISLDRTVTGTGASSAEEKVARLPVTVTSSSTSSYSCAMAAWSESNKVMIVSKQKTLDFMCVFLLSSYWLICAPVGERNSVTGAILV